MPILTKYNQNNIPITEQSKMYKISKDEAQEIIAPIWKKICKTTMGYNIRA